MMDVDACTLMVVDRLLSDRSPREKCDITESRLMGPEALLSGISVNCITCGFYGRCMLYRMAL